MSNENKDKKNGIIKALSFYSQIGVTIVSCILIGVLIGKLLDRLLGTGPWLLLLFSLFGVGAAIKALFELGKDDPY